MSTRVVFYSRTTALLSSEGHAAACSMVPPPLHSYESLEKKRRRLDGHGGERGLEERDRAGDELLGGERHDGDHGEAVVLGGG